MHEMRTISTEDSVAVSVSLSVTRVQKRLNGSSPVWGGTQGPYWPLYVSDRNSVPQDGDHYRNPSFIYNCNVLDAGFAML